MKRLFTSLFASRKRYTPPKEVAAKFRDVFAVEAFLMPEAVEDVKRCIVHPGDEVLPGVKCPENLNALSIGELMDLMQMKGDSMTLFRECASKLLHMDNIDADIILDMPAYKVYGFINFALVELKRVGEMFETIKAKPTRMEREAGIHELNFGAFGIIDSYAQRMHITTHDEAAQTPWLNVFACMKIDYKHAEYRKRLQELSMTASNNN